MSVFSILETLLIGPLKLVFEVIFQFTNGLVDNPAVSIIVLSLLMNILVLPLYRRADAMQEQARDTEERLKDGVAHIKKTFSGDERMMMLQTYYRQNNYKPTDVLKGSVSLLLEIPFFMAAYQFLSGLGTLSGASLGPIADLGAPDGLIVIGSLSINLLPFLMTFINIISSALYLKGFPLKTKIQLYGMALFFLVFLYTSPAGLVFYWTLNNVFSLVKNIFYKLKDPKKGIAILASGAGILLLAGLFFVGAESKLLLRICMIAAGVLLQLPMVFRLVSKKIKLRFKPITVAPDRKCFTVAALFLAVFIGLLIPSNFIAASPQEYVDVTYFHHPIWFMVSSVALSAGFFLIWFNVFYWLASDSGKVVFERIMWLCCGGAIVNYMFFGTKLGNISNKLKFDSGLSFSVLEIVINVLVLAAIGVGMYFVLKKWASAVKAVLFTGVLAVVIMSGINIFTVNASIESITVEQKNTRPHFELSREGNNVVVILLDRAMGEYVPYIFNEVEGLEEKFDGFTFYNNTISYGGHTNMGAPALMGGYEYTPVELNKRDEESIADKHNESLKVMPVIFSEAGYNVTVCDAPYANYKSIPDLSIYDEYPGINTYITEGEFGNSDMKQAYIDNNYRNFFCFSLMKSLPLFCQYAVYDGGNYYQAYSGAYAGYKTTSMTTSEGYDNNFMEGFEVLRNLGTMAEVTDGDSDNFLFLYNDTPHEPVMMQEPEFVPAEKVDNTEYEKTVPDRFTLDGKSIEVKTEKQLLHYQTNAATLVELGNWFDYLRDNGVYDNTKIILVADHGYYLYQSEELVYDMGDGTREDISNYFPLLMVKDFGSEGFEISDEFMTNADVPTLATDGAVENPVNPFTGKPINSDEKTAHDQYVMLSHIHQIKKNNGNTFIASRWAAITNNIWDREDWEFCYDEVVLQEHEMP
ncbi:MAG: YidC/Oxa1 family membrane protein insertase [Clostridia bacterium]|nr:YidC/Oxa1 family membrane protein insertase [Clostridia bacterium]